jgi:hypothetical protein
MKIFIKNLAHDAGRAVLNFIYPRMNEFQILIPLAGGLFAFVHWLSDASNRNKFFEVGGSSVLGWLVMIILVLTYIKVIYTIFTKHALKPGQKDFAAVIIFAAFGYVGYTLFFTAHGYAWTEDIWSRVNFAIGIYFAVLNAIRSWLLLLTARFTGKLISFTGSRVLDVQLTRGRLTLGVLSVLAFYIANVNAGRGILFSMYMAVNYVLLADMALQAFAPFHRLSLYRVGPAVPRRGDVASQGGPLVRHAPLGYTRTRRSLRRRTSIAKANLPQ